jgi:hypothetical protein
MIRALVFALLLITTYFGLADGPLNLRDAESPGQLFVAVAVTLYGLAGLASMYGLWRRKPWTRVSALLWAIGSITAATAAPVVYGGGEVSVLAVLAGSVLAAVLVGAVVVYVVRDLKRESASDLKEG